ncbi:hypothetical protein HYW41_01335 [Candidatus Daviesbacteria bacterium]|nr:hypothetical protein [Candidatus Daviesbacteria bacterium]
MNQKKIEETIGKAIYNLFDKQPNIFSFTSQTHQTEWNLGHHLAEEISDLWPEFDCDVDVVKTNFANNRPDIILHKRGKQSDNFLVIELKKDDTSNELGDDTRKIQQEWFQTPLLYKWGAIININSDKTYYIKVFKNGPNSYE